jgi:hypothetical protein
MQAAFMSRQGRHSTLKMQQGMAQQQSNRHIWSTLVDVMPLI